MTRSWLLRVALIVAVGLSAIVGLQRSPTAAAPGDLDLTFDGDGTFIQMTQSGGGLAITSTGKVALAGTCIPDSTSVCVTRLNPDGTFDASFDIDGLASTALSTYQVAVTGAAVDSGDRLVVIGQCDLADDFGNRHVCLARFLEDGTLDTSFNEDGKTVVARDPFFSFP